jgi:hypothetical protein
VVVGVVTFVFQNDGLIEFYIDDVSLKNDLKDKNADFKIPPGISNIMIKQRKQPI